MGLTFVYEEEDSFVCSWRVSFPARYSSEFYRASLYAFTLLKYLSLRNLKKKSPKLVLIIIFTLHWEKQITASIKQPLSVVCCFGVPLL